MAKGNMLLGYARGSVGDVTFYRDGGLQRARARNRKPANPRSNKQQTQRALFANCVKFYKLTAAKFFKFAFENKAVNESDYNAFMRENVRRGVMMSRTAFYVEPYPALGNWLMSRGSLPTIDNANDDNTNAPMFDLGAPFASQPSATTTIAELSTAMIATGRYQVGDIITLIKYGADGEDIPSATPTQEYAQVFFNYYQFLIDPNNGNSFASIFGDLARFYLAKTTDGNLAIAFGSSSASANESWRLYWQGATVIHSRNTSTGLKVSTQELTVNPRYQDAITTALNDTNYISAVLADWDAQGLAILQGDGLDLQSGYALTAGTGLVELMTSATATEASWTETVDNEGVANPDDYTDGQYFRALTINTTYMSKQDKDSIIALINNSSNALVINDEVIDAEITATAGSGESAISINVTATEYPMLISDNSIAVRIGGSVLFTVTIHYGL